MIKYDLIARTMRHLKIPKLSLKPANYLYEKGRDFIDLSTDENGLWAIYGLPGNNNTIVMKIDPWDLKVNIFISILFIFFHFK